MISIQHLTFGYRKRQTVLEDLNLELPPGHIYGLLGRNGVGKSSLLHHLCGLLFPDQGSCQVMGQIPGRRAPSFLQQIFLLPEEIYIPDIPIRRYLHMQAPFYPTFDTFLFYAYLKEFNVPVENTLQGMSYGQKKKVMISFALATRAKVLLLDEPTNGLDIPSKRQFRKIIAGSLREDQLMLISTHQVKDLDSLIDYVLVIEDKKIIIQAPIDQITEKLVFRQVMDLNEITAPIYSEGGLKGHAVVAHNHDLVHSRMDMEMFFNAVLIEKNQILPLFNQ